MDEFDYVVVGAGSAGCALAERLSRDGRASVALLEAGGSDRGFWIRTPIGYGKTFHDPRINWRYQSEAVPGLDGRTAYLPRGKVLGGSSSINAMVYCRGLIADYDDWRQAGNTGWGWNDVAPMFQSLETHFEPDGTRRGAGPLAVSHRDAEYHGLKRHFYSAAAALGVPVTADLDPAGGDCIFPFAITTRHGVRCSAADAFLRPALRRPNLELRAETLVERIVFAQRRAVGVSVRRGAQSRTIRARGEVILCAGAIGSPALLQRSGIGPARTLGALGVTLVRAHDGVGRHLQDHVGINYFYRATEPTLNATLGAWPGRITAGLRYLLTRGGPLSISVNQIGGVVRGNPALVRPNLQLYLNPLSYSTETVGKRELLRPDPWPGFIIGFNSCRPTSEGSIEISSPDPEVAPSIQPNYLATEHDREEAVAGARFVARLAATPAMRSLIAAAATDIDAASDAEILADFRARSGTVHHLCGTCRMAPEAAGGVVGADLKLHGVQGLRVADASIFPNITSANTNAPAIMVGARAGEIILAS